MRRLLQIVKLIAAVLLVLLALPVVPLLLGFAIITGAFIQDPPDDRI